MKNIKRLHSTVRRQALACMLTSVVLATMAAAQVPPNYKGQPSSPQDETGFTSYAGFSGSTNSLGHVLKLDSSVGYNFSSHFGVDFGVPFYFVSSSGTSTSSNALGNVYVDMRLKLKNPVVNYQSVLTGYAPTGDATAGLSTGRGTFDWTNHFDRSFGKLTPFAEAGVANTIADSQFFNRPFTSLGFNTHFRAGASFDLWKLVSVGASAYDILPSGQQKIYSRLVAGGTTGSSGPGDHGRVFETAHATVGSADIARDNGFNAFVGASPSPYVDLQLGYTHSVHYALDTVSFSVGVNVGSLARKHARP
jgi:hypothetical protein